MFFIEKNSSENIYPTKPIQYPRSSSFHPSTSLMSTKTIEQKLRNLQLNLAQDRSPSELAQSGIYFRPTSPSTPQQNIFSNYIDSVHRALDSSKQTPTNDLYSTSPYANPYIQYDYQRQQPPSFQINFNPPSNYPIRPPVPPRQSSLCLFL